MATSFLESTQNYSTLYPHEFHLKLLILAFKECWKLECDTMLLQKLNHGLTVNLCNSGSRSLGSIVNSTPRFH